MPNKLLCSEELTALKNTCYEEVDSTSCYICEKRHRHLKKTMSMSMSFFHTVSISASYLNISFKGLVLPNLLLIQLIFFKVFLKVFSLKGHVYVPR